MSGRPVSIDTPDRTDNIGHVCPASGLASDSDKPDISDKGVSVVIISTPDNEGS